MRYLLGIDNGGTMTKAAIFDERGREVAVASVETPLETPHPGWNQRDMELLWQANVSCIKNVIGKSGISAAQIAGIGCTGHGKGLYLWGKDGKPAYPGIASTDRRAEQIVAQWYADGTAERANPQVLQPVISCQPVSLLRWIAEHEPDVLKNVQWIFECKDYIRFRLTGKALAETTDYSGTCLMDLNKVCFDRDLLAIFGIEKLYECLPPICNAWDLCGCVTEEVAELTGLAPGTPVCGGMFDIDACAVASGVTDSSQLCMITGTWSINEYPASAPVRPDTSTHNSIFCLDNTYLIEESSPTSAGNLEWFLEHFMKAERLHAEEEGRSIFDLVNALVASVAPEDDEILFLPFLYGSNTAVSNGAFIGLSNAHSTAHLLRAIYEGVVFSHRMHYEKLLAFREKPEAIRLAGGASKSDVWVQMFADVLQIPIEVVSTKELGTQGCAMAAAVAAGIYPDPSSAIQAMMPSVRRVMPNPAHKDIYDSKYRRYCALTDALKGF